MPIRIVEKDPVRMKDKKTTAKWITKKPKKWITKKSDPKWITKKAHKAEMDLGGTKREKPKSWITKKAKPIKSIRQTVKDVVAEGGSPKLTTDEARMGRIDKKLGIIPGRAGKQHGGRTRLLEELGRVEAEPSNRNRRAEISRVHGELNKGYKGGKRVGLKHGTRGPHGFGPKPFLNKPGQAQGTHGGKIAKAFDKAIKGNKLTKKA